MPGGIRGQRTRNPSGESKKKVKCGVCGKEMRRDNLKHTHFPNKHPNSVYYEMGERKITNPGIPVRVLDNAPQMSSLNCDKCNLSFSTTNDLKEHVQTEHRRIPQTPGFAIRVDGPVVENIEDDDDIDMHSINVSMDEAAHIEEPIEEPLINKIVNDEIKKNYDTLKNSLDNANAEQRKFIEIKMDELCSILKEKINIEQSTKGVNTAVSEEPSGEEIKVLRVKTAKDIQNLLLHGELSSFTNQNKILCTICADSPDSDKRKHGEFSYVFELGTDFNHRPQIREFRQLKSIVVKHIESKYHKEMVKVTSENDKKEEAEERYNYTAGMNLASQVYMNTKNKDSFIKYENDCMQKFVNGEKIGNTNHSKNFAKKLTDDIGTEIKIGLTKHFTTPLKCTGQLPPLAYTTDKMTMKRKTRHISAVITPDPDAPLSGPFMKPVFIGMPKVTGHTGYEISKQMIDLLDIYIANIEEQLQSVSNDGQYVHLGIKKHFMDLRQGFKDQIDWLIFSWDPAHKLSLAENDTRKDNADGTKKVGSLKDVTDTVQDIWKHVSYGKHNEEYEVICEELNIKGQNAPLTFSDTRFAQYAFFVLRNFRHSYQALMQQLQAENDVKDGKEMHIRDNLKKATSVEFVVALSGSVDIYRIQQILSQQSQKVDQQIYEVYENIKKQRDNLKKMATDLELSDRKHPSDWTVDDLEDLDILLWANLKDALNQILEENSFKKVKLHDDDEKFGIAKAIVEMRNHLQMFIQFLDQRFENDFDSEFVQEVKDVLDLNYMLDMKIEIDNNEKTYESCIEEIEEKGNSALTFLLLRQSKKNPPTTELRGKIQNQYKDFKQFSFEMLMNLDMNLQKHQIKEVSCTVTAVCLTCHKRYPRDMIQKHVMNIHQGENTSFADVETKFLSTKILHGICKNENLYDNKQEFLTLALKLLCKSPNESVVECIGSVAELHAKPQRNANYRVYETELHIDWNGPNLTKARPLIERALDRHFGSRKKWHFKTGNSKYFTSKVVDRKMKESSRLSFMEK